MRAMRFAAGVYTSTGLGTGGPIRPATAYPEPGEPVPVDSVALYTASYIRKNAQLRGIWAHLLLVAALLAACAVRQLPGPALHTDAGLAAHQLRAAEFGAVRTPADLFAHVEAVAAAAVASRDPSAHGGFSGDRLVAVGAVVVRQYRTRRKAASIGTGVLGPALFPALPSLLTAPLPYGHLEQFFLTIPGAGSLDSAPIDAPGHAFLSVEDARRMEGTVNATDPLLAGPNPAVSVRPYRPPAMVIGGRTFPASAPQYQLGPFPVSGTRGGHPPPEDVAADIARRLRGAKDSAAWLTDASRAVLVETLWLHPPSGITFHGVNVLLSLAAGNTEHRTLATPLLPLDLTAPASTLRFRHGVAALVMDLLLVAALAAVGWHWVQRLRANAALTRSYLKAVLSFWPVVDAVVVAPLVAVAVALHAVLFAFAGTAAAADPVEQMERTVAATEVHFAASRLRAWAVIAVLLRALSFFQHIRRLAIVTETIRAATHDLLGVSLLFFTFAFACSVAATVLFGENMALFATAFKSFDFLAQLVGSGQLDGAQAFEDVNPIASVFFVAYLFAVILLLLNVVIGILASAFVYSSESMNLVWQADWSPEAVWREARALCVRLWWLQKQAPPDAATAPGDPNDGEEGLDAVATEQAYLAVHVAVQSLRLIAKAKAAALPRQHGPGHGDVVEDRSASPASPASAASPGSAAPASAAAAPSLAFDPAEHTMSLHQLRHLCQPYLTAQGTSILFRKAQEQHGTSNGKTRFLRLFARQRQRERQLGDLVTAQLSQVRDLKAQLLGVPQVGHAADHDVDGDVQAMLGNPDAADAADAHSFRLPVYGGHSATARPQRQVDHFSGDTETAQLRPLLALRRGFEELGRAGRAVVDTIDADADTVAAIADGVVGAAHTVKAAVALSQAEQARAEAERTEAERTEAERTEAERARAADELPAGP